MRATRASIGERQAASCARAGACVGFACAALAWFGCAASTKTTTSDFDPQGSPGSSYSVQSTLVSKDRAQLDHARELARGGDYGGAFQILNGLANKHDMDSKLRQDVLLTLGEMHGSALNPAPDYDKGTAVLQQLLSEYPKTEYRERAESLLAQYAKHRAGN
jgi:hypothetical protein